MLMGCSNCGKEVLMVTDEQWDRIGYIFCLDCGLKLKLALTRRNMDLEDFLSNTLVTDGISKENES